MLLNIANTETKKATTIKRKSKTVDTRNSTNNSSLILFNDEINTFDFVISCLIDICNHSETQAEQLTMLVHFKGKANVKEGRRDRLMRMCNQLTDKGLSAEVQ